MLNTDATITKISDINLCLTCGPHAVPPARAEAHTGPPLEAGRHGRAELGRQALVKIPLPSFISFIVRAVGMIGRVWLVNFNVTFYLSLVLSSHPPDESLCCHSTGLQPEDI